VNSLRRYLPLVLKMITRHRLRSLLTVLGVALAMFLFGVVQAMQVGVRRATQLTAQDNTLVVYRENRYCPFASQLPQFYQQRIARIDGVADVVPVRIVVSNCRASLDVVTFRGVPQDEFARTFLPRMELIEGSLADWRKRSDAALLGESLARRRGVRLGARFTAAGISVYVAGIVRSDDAQDRNVAYTHLAFLQETATRGGTGGVVTQFNVSVRDAARLDAVAAAIDAEFATEREPTKTWPEKTFVARAAADLVALVDFAGMLALGALAAVLALVGNAIVLAVQDRVRDHAVLQTLGYRGGLIARLVLAEGGLLGFAGGVVGAAAAYGVVHWGGFSFASEGVNIELAAAPGTLFLGAGLAVALGALASLVPAWQASRREIAASFRTV
jgi:putative ABC transport system permease protein